MKISFIHALQNKVLHRCGICHEDKLLEYIVIDEKDNFFGICRECRDNAIEPEG
jgi:hypothetical protein